MVARITDDASARAAFEAVKRAATALKEREERVAHDHAD